MSSALSSQTVSNHRSGARILRWHPTGSAIVWGFCIALTLLLFELLPARGSFLERYVSLAQYDTYWFENIAAEGYHSEGLPSEPTGLDRSKENVAFFPAYPLLGRFIAWTTGLPIILSLLIGAQLSCWGLCTYLLLLLRRWRVPLSIAITAMVLIFS